MKTNALAERWLAQLGELWPVAKGSINEVRKSCSRSGCRACASGVKHPVWLFTYRQDGRLHSLHVPKEMVPLVKQAIENGRRLEGELVQAGVALIRDRERKQR